MHIECVVGCAVMSSTTSCFCGSILCINARWSRQAIPATNACCKQDGRGGEKRIYVPLGLLHFFLAISPQTRRPRKEIQRYATLCPGTLNTSPRTMQPCIQNECSTLITCVKIVLIHATLAISKCLDASPVATEASAWNRATDLARSSTSLTCSYSTSPLSWHKAPSP